MHTFVLTCILFQYTLLNMFLSNFCCVTLVLAGSGDRSFVAKKSLIFNQHNHDNKNNIIILCLINKVFVYEQWRRHCCRCFKLFDFHIKLI